LNKGMMLYLYLVSDFHFLVLINLINYSEMCYIYKFSSEMWLKRKRHG
jgi:hypothetical protein